MARDNLDTTISIRVTADEAQALELLASEDDRSVSAYVRRLIRVTLDAREEAAA